MNVLVIGQGGREHALVMAFKSSPQVNRIFALPGNDGMAQIAERVSLLSNDHKGISNFCKTQKIGLVVIGPEAELVAGLADDLRNAGVRVFGPSKAAAQLEGSKIFAKEFMLENKIPTGRAEIVDSVAAIKKVVAKFSPPFVLKADGLAAGKGVFICDNEKELLSAAEYIFERKGLGAAGERALLEEFLPGPELSWLVITNGKKYSSLPLCRDHKRLCDGDKGPNTGGMGVIGPIKIDEELRAQIEQEVVVPTVSGIARRGFEYYGVVYIGLILSEKGPRVLEYNVRFGDPECQVIMPLLDGDWCEVLTQFADGEAPSLAWKNLSVACVVLAAEGYPDKPVKGVRIEGDSTYRSDVADKNGESYLLHAGARREGDHFVTNGGRVLNAVGTGKDLSAALKNAYAASTHATWPGRQIRMDIGK